MMLQRYWPALAITAILLAGMGYAVWSSQTLQHCIDTDGGYPATQDDEHETPLVAEESATGFALYFQCGAVFANVYGSAITALATAFLTIVTGGLVWLGWLQFNVTRVQSRAHIFPIELAQFYEFDQAAQQFNWRFAPIWANTGDTHTVDLRVACECEIRNAPLQGKPNFGSITNVTRGLIAPKNKNIGPQAPLLPAAAISPHDIDDCQKVRRFLYLYGWARYRDIFPGTKEHVTRFCWAIVSRGDPFKFVPNDPQNALTFNYMMHNDGNSADDE